jgi:uncharacterized delta-60 repeat protein
MPLEAPACIDYRDAMHSSLRPRRGSRVLGLLAVLAALAAIAPTGAGAAPGDLDPSFGEGGVVRMLTSQEKISARDVAVQPDDKVVFTGKTEADTLLVARLLENGSLDPSFGSGGIAPAPPVLAEGRAVAIQPDDKIVVAGEAQGAANGDFFVARYLTNGMLDPAFGGGDGIVIAPIGTLGDRAEAVAIGADGRIVATGEVSTAAAKMELGVLVLQPDGAPDPGFGAGGVKKFNTLGAEEFDQGDAVAVRGDGRIVLGDNSATGAGKGFELVQLLAGGGFDLSFGGGDGVALTPIPVLGTMGNAGQLNDLALLPGGGIAAVGTGYDELGLKHDDKTVVVRYLPNGEPDPGFGDAGIFATHLAGPGARDQAVAIELGDDGKLLVGAEYDAAVSVNSQAVLRLDAAGEPDPGFGSEGIVRRGETAPFGETFEGSAVDSYGRLLTAGRTYNGGGQTTVTIARYLGDRLPPLATSAPANQPPHARMKKLPKNLRAAKLKRFAGTARDGDGDGLRKVQVALVRLVRGGARAARVAARPQRRGAKTCLVLKNARARFKRVRVKKGKRCPQRWLTAKGKAKWSFELRRPLPPGRYVVYARAIDGQGLAETRFTRKLGNRYAFRVLAAR